MVYLLKEALKTLCGVNQWSYAVYWKIGCQNPKLLIWEECYYEPASYSGLLIGNGGPQTYNLESCIQSVDKVHFLINKMMEDKHVNIVGQGLVGRVALTGNHHWILSDNYFNETCPPQVLKEVFQQFSAGMKTVAVIPVLPHGVVQFGSYKTVMENMGFVQDVKSLICQLSENYTAKELDPKIEVPECIGNASPGEFSLESNLFNDSSLFDSLNYFGNSAETSLFESQTSYSSTNEIRIDPIPNISTFQATNSNSTHFKPHDYRQKAQINSAMKFQFSQLMNGVAKAEVIPSSAEIWMKNQHASQYIPKPNRELSSRSYSGLTNGGGQGHFSNSNVSTGILTSSGLAYNFSDGFVNVPSFEVNGLCHDVTRIMEPDTKGEAVENLTSTNPNEGKNVSFGQTDKKQKFIAQIHSPNISRCNDAFLQPQSGDDLFDILGADYKSNLLNSSLSNELASNTHNWDKSNFPSKASSEIYTSSRTDHLLDAVVSKVNPLTKQSLDDNVSCKTTMTNASSSFSALTSLPYCQFGVSDQLNEELLGVPKYQAKPGAMASSSFRTGSSKEETVTYSQCSSVYGSQESSWIGKGQIAKQKNSVSTGNSMKQGEMVKTNRKRLKPGENPRPRPKDRQMIQDRVKELREIVPNGAKCSIDALLERTIKHMLFLQSVTKHADKLKQTNESKIFSKDGGLVLKDNFDGGATWAYELGSQSMVCPIIVEDLDQPRQMLVEMLCEERGLFLEIADMIRGMGLTILKGVMETRKDKIWARFAVEANRDVTRMEIFMSLVRLLDQTAKTCASQPNGLSCENMMVQSQ